MLYEQLRFLPGLKKKTQQQNFSGLLSISHIRREALRHGAW